MRIHTKRCFNEANLFLHKEAHHATVLLTFKKWRLQREGRRSRRQNVEMKSDWLFDKPRSNYWLRVAASNLASQSPRLATYNEIS